MARTPLTDFTGAEIKPGKLVVYATRRGNRVRQTEATVVETKTNRAAGRVVPVLTVRPTGRESGISARKTLRLRTIGAEHVVVIGDAEVQA
ncbi:hypothetical protein OG554_03530 [Streptomyces griseus]|uniref:hypothetical protein n=1 Tax=Streptomyces griseus TaxID=1911 RepID=UPI00386CD0B9|nr:hypothetical protein OG554_03530 [Streptomyces fimicarius]